MIKKIETVLLMGGGELMWQYLTYLRYQNMPKVLVLSSKRHLDEPIMDMGSLRDALLTTETQFVELQSLSPLALEKLDIDPAVTVAFSFGAPWIIKQDVIDCLNGRIYNLHGTRLPQDRGGASVSWQIMRGNKYGFALIHRIDAGIDTGDIVGYHEFIYDGCKTPIDYQRRCAQEALALLERYTMQLLEGNEPIRLPQAPYFSTYWPRLNTEQQGWIDWSWSGNDIWRFICAFDEPYVGAHTLLDDQTIYLKNCNVEISDGTFHPFQSGLIYRVTEQYIAVCVTTGSLLITHVYNDQHNIIPLSTLKVGSRLYTPSEMLESAKRSRVHYTPLGLRDLT